MLKTAELVSTSGTTEHLLAWAAARDDIRAVLLTSPHTGPLADLDVTLVVRDAARWAADDVWHEAFGAPLLVRFRPADVARRLVVYDDGLCIDFAIRQAGSAAGRLDQVCRVLVDKDGLAPALLRTSAVLPIESLTAAEYQALVEEFWWEGTFAARSLWHGQTRLARVDLVRVIKGDLLPRMLAWRGWPFRSGPRFHPGAIRAVIEIACAGKDPADDWGALWGACDLFHEAAFDVAAALGCDYPDALEEKA